MGISYHQDGLFQMHRVNGATRDLGIDMVLPGGSEVSLELNGNSTEAASLVQVGGDRWPIESLPVVLAK
jgi:hypothetical protein